MIKKLIGMLFAAATLAVIVFAVLGREGYRSLLAHELSAAAQPADPHSAPKSAAETETSLDEDDASSAITSPDEYFEDDEELPSDLFQEDATL